MANSSQVSEQIVVLRQKLKGKLEEIGCQQITADYLIYAEGNLAGVVTCKCVLITPDESVFTLCVEAMIYHDTFPQETIEIQIFHQELGKKINLELVKRNLGLLGLEWTSPIENGAIKFKIPHINYLNHLPDVIKNLHDEAKGMLPDKEILPDILAASIGIYCETDIKKTNDEHSEELLFRETRDFNFYLGNLGTSNEEKLTTAKRILDELAEELCHITGFGVYRSRLTTYHNRKRVLLENEYTQFHPIGQDVFQYCLELNNNYGGQRANKIVLPYYYNYYGNDTDISPKSKRLKYEKWYDIRYDPDMSKFKNICDPSFQPKELFYYYRDGGYHFENFQDPLFERFLRKFMHPTEGGLYYYQSSEQTHQRYTKIEEMHTTVLPTPRRSILLQGDRKRNRKIKEFRAKKAKEERMLRKKQGKPPVPEKIYVIQMTDQIYKIGVSTRPKTRLRGLQTSSPHKLTLVHTFPADHGKAAEEKLHQFFHPHRLEGEWFQLDESQKNLLRSITEYKHGKFLSATENHQIHELNRL